MSDFLSPQIKQQILIRLPLAPLGAGLLFFGTAGTLVYWEAWVYMMILFLPAFFLVGYLMKYEPKLLERRLRKDEKEPEQQRIVKWGAVFFLAAFLLPGFDQRYGWSSVSPGLVIAADLAVLLGIVLFTLVLKENRFASRVIEVEQEQEVITTGPYAQVRHPMYVAVLLIYVFSPLALGSYWAMIPALFLIVFAVARIRNEEAVLLRDLKGYQKYTEKVQSRLIPGVW
jgi:protein-S-isoprenylcysteine O-methyltransferase Ste14